MAPEHGQARLVPNLKSNRNVKSEKSKRTNHRFLRFKGRIVFQLHNIRLTLSWSLQALA